MKWMMGEAGFFWRTAVSCDLCTKPTGAVAKAERDVKGRQQVPEAAFMVYD